MENKQVKFLIYRLFVAIFFIAWGIIWLVFHQANAWGNVLKLFCIAVGVFYLYTSSRELIKYKKTGEVKNRIDERGELNNLRAAKRGFNFFMIGFAVLFALRGLDLISEKIFVAVSGPVIAVGVIIYFISYHIFERKG